MTKKTKLIILGILSLLVGIVSLPLWFIYVLLIDSDYAFLIILCIAFLIWGIQLLVKATKLKSADT
jgi:hypothetical protein